MDLQLYQEPMAVGKVANIYAAQNVFTDYQERKAVHTRRRQRADLSLFTRYLHEAGLEVQGLYDTPSSWEPITYGLVDGFVRWMLREGYAIGSVNVRLSTVKEYCDLATRATVLSTDENALIKLVKGYKYNEGRNLDELRITARIGRKKAEALLISKEQCSQLKAQPATPQGRRDTLLICLLFDHGLRCGEVADLLVSSLNIAEGTITFYRKKVGKVQTHELTRDTLVAAQRYFEKCHPEHFLLMGSRKGGTMQGGMSGRAITARVRELCLHIGIVGASAHDGRHAWATFAVRGGTDLKTLKDAGGWNSIAMPDRYAASQVIANKGVNLG
jgi:integrase